MYIFVCYENHNWIKSFRATLSICKNIRSFIIVQFRNVDTIFSVYYQCGYVLSFFDNTWCEDDKCYFLTCVFLITEDVFALIFPNDLNKTHILLLRSVDFIFFFGFYDFLRLGLLLIWKESAVKMATHFLLVVCFFLIDTSYVPIVSFDVTLNFRYRLVHYSCRHQFYVCQN